MIATERIDHDAVSALFVALCGCDVVVVVAAISVQCLNTLQPGDFRIDRNAK